MSEDEIDVDVSFDEYGINSVMIVELNKSFEDVFGSLSKTLFFEYSNIEELAEYFIESHQDKLHEVLGLAGASVAVHEDVVVQAQAAPQPQTAPPTPIGNLAVQEDSTNQLFDACCAHIKDLLSDPVGLSADEIDTDTSFEEYGINSVMIVELNKAFENIYGSLSKTLFFEYDNVEELAEYLIENHLSTLKTIVRIDATVDSASVPSASVVNTPVLNTPAVNNIPVSNAPTNNAPASNTAPAELQSIAPSSQGGQAIASSYAASEQKQTTEDLSNDVAIIGVDGRYPGAKNVDQFWELLKNGDDAITEIPGSHFDYAPYFDADPEKDKIYSNKGGFIDDVDKFDASFFNISPREAELIDPQERLFLEVTWGALEDAGYTQKSLLDASDREVGVFVGALWQPYQAIGTEETMKGNTVAPSGLLYSIANRVSYYLNLSGPSLAIDTACSASLTAVHVACQSIASGDCKLAIAGGVNVSLHASKYLFLSQNRFLSTDGRCRSFGDGGDGYVPGEGVGAILLKPMAQAIKDGDNIYAVIKGSSVNHGGKTHGYTVPNPNAQAKLIQKVQKKSNIDPRTISYIEAHGTGTPLGDPIEITGLNKAFEASKNDKQFCAIGSVKSNIGHLEAAAGIAAITKVILQMKYKQLVPSIHSDTLNPNINFEESAFKVQRELAAWPQPQVSVNGVMETYTRRSGISSFGAGGANAHIILEEFDPVVESSDTATPAMIVLSAKNRERLDEVVANLHAYLVSNSQTGTLSDIAYTLQIGREAMSERLGFVVRSKADLQEKLKVIIDGSEKKSSAIYRANADKSRDAMAVFRGDDDFSLVVASWITKAKHNKVLDIWVRGFNVDWSSQYQGVHPQRISLPTYPFAKERYWLPENNDSSTPIGGLNASRLHPLLHENTSNLAQQRFSSVFTGHEFFLAHHLVGQDKVLPAVAYIEMFRVASVYSDRQLIPHKLLNLAWMKPIVVGDIAEKISIEVNPEDDEIFLHAVRKTHGGNDLHAQGELVYMDGEQQQHLRDSLDAVDLSALEVGLTQSAQRAEIYAVLHRKGLNLQAGFQGLNWIKWNETSAFGEVSLPAIISKDERFAYQVHPSLLDSALQVALTVLETEHKHSGALYLPFSIEEVEFISPLPDTIYSSVTPCDGRSMVDSQSPVRSFDVSLFDAQGRVLVKVKNISFKETNLSSGSIKSFDAKGDDTEVAYSAPEWIRESIAEKNLSVKNILVISNDEFALNDFSSEFTQSDSHAPLIKLIFVDAHKTSEFGTFYINKHKPVDYSAFIDYLTRENIELSHIVWLWNSSIGQSLDNAADVANNALSKVFDINKLLLKPSRSIHQYFIDRTPKNTINIALQSTIYGFLKSLNTEFSKLKNRVVSLEYSADKVGNNEASWASCAIDEIRFDDGLDHAWVRYPANRSRRERWQMSELKNEARALALESSVIQENGTYLISGGLGGLGKILTTYLAANYSVNFVLIGRSSVNEAGQAHIDNLRARGSKVLYQQADITNIEALKHVVAEAKRVHGDIDGVIHAAGVLDDNFLANKTAESLEKVCEPKIQGCDNLDRVTRDEPLAFFLVFSSLTSILGNVGQCDYAAANGFMDGFISHREALVDAGDREGFSLAINWPFWGEGQMGNEGDDDVSDMLDDAFGEPISNADGLTAFEEIFHLGKHQVAVVKRSHEISQVPDITGEQKTPSRVNSAAQTTVTQSSVADGDLSNTVFESLRDIVVKKGKFNPDKINLQSDFIELGLESIFLTRLASLINKKYGTKLSPAVFFEYTNFEQVVNYLLEEYPEKIANEHQTESLVDQAPEPTDASASRPEALKPISFNHARSKGYKAKPAKEKTSETPRVAVIGMDCLLPGAPDLTSFWKLLSDKTSAVSEIPEARWDWRKYDGDPTKEMNKTNIKWGGFVDDLDKFDASFFNISPREATLMDPQQRVLLQSVWRAVEHSGYAPLALSKESKVGFYLGASTNDYYEMLTNTDVEAYSSTGAIHSISANRVSYIYDFKGPSIPVDTACSSSLVALDMAVQSLEEGRCDVAIVGGVNALITPTLYLAFSKAGMLSTSGNISPLDKGANGYVRGEGVGVIVLKRAEQAIKDKDEIHALIKGTSVNHGGKVSSLTVPNPKAQSELILDACKKADVDVGTLNYIEMHGTGTPLGDPIEVNGLKSAFKHSEFNGEQGYCGISSVKGNIGHLEAAAGIAGLIKSILSLKHKQLPGLCNFNELNPHIDLDGSPFRVVRDLEEWVSLKDSKGRTLPRRAGISSFGFGGANAHAIVEEYIDASAEDKSAPEGLTESVENHVFILSAKGQDVLKEQAADLRQFVQQEAHVSLNRIAYTLQIGREEMSERLAIVADSKEALISKLSCYIDSLGHQRDVFIAKASQSASGSALKQSLRMDAEQCRTLAAQWVEGQAIDWLSLYENSVPQRIALPTYPFSKERFWLENSPRKTEVSAEKNTSLLHPLVHENISNFSAQKFRSTFNFDEPLLSDAVVNGERTLPGVTLLEMAQVAVKQSLGKGAEPQVLRLQNVSWENPLQMNADSCELTIALSVDAEASESLPEWVAGQVNVQPAKINYEIYSGEQTRLIHNRGTAVVGLAEVGRTVEALNLDNIRQRCKGNVLNKQQAYAQLNTNGLAYGAYYQAIETVHAGNEEVLAKLALPQVLISECADYVLHPAIIDAALQASIGLHRVSPLRSAYTVSMKSLDILAPCGESVWAWLRYSPKCNDKQALNIDLCNETGEVCVQIKDLILECEGSQSASLETTAVETKVFEAKTVGAVHTPVEEIRARGVAYFKNVAASTLHMPVEKVDSSLSLEQYGMDSILVIQLINTLRGDFPDITGNLLLDYRTIDALVDYFITSKKETLVKVLGLTQTNAVTDDTRSKPSDINDLAAALSSGKMDFKEAMKKLKSNKEGA